MMREFAYGAYNDLVIDLINDLSKVLPMQKIESVIFKEAMYKWAQTFFTARSEKEIDKRNDPNNNNEGTLTEKELKDVGKSRSGITEQIKACLFPNEQDIPDHIILIFNEFSMKCNIRLEDYNQYWHPFYALQQSEMKNQLGSLNSAAFFDPRVNPQISTEIMQKVWRQHVIPEINKKIDELKQEGKKTSDAKITLAECLNKHMAFIDYMVENAKQYIGTTQKQLNEMQDINLSKKFT